VILKLGGQMFKLKLNLKLNYIKKTI
jgi:hypothetical protein